MHLWNIFAKGRGRNFPAFTLSLLTILSSLFFPPSASVCQDAYTVISVENGGSISGTVCLKAAANIGTMTITQDKKQCGKTKRSPRLVVSNDLGVANAIVFIEDIKSGKSFERQPSYVLAQKNCEFLPHISLIPLGERLEIVNHDAVLHNVHAYDSNVEPKTIFNLAQPVKNLRTKTRQMLNPGIINLQCDAGHAWMSASLMVIEHPYYTITATDGTFRLNDVPPGMYQLRMWHEGVAILDRRFEHGNVTKYQFEDAYTDSLSVTIRPHINSVADFELVLR